MRILVRLPETDSLNTHDHSYYTTKIAKPTNVGAMKMIIMNTSKLRNVNEQGLGILELQGNSKNLMM